MEARHLQVIWLPAQGRSSGATSKITSFGTRWIALLLERYNASGPDALANGRRRNGLKPSLLTPEVLEMVRLRLAEPPPDGGLWSGRKVADVVATHLGLERVPPQRGWDALKAIGWCLQRPRPKNPKSATPAEAEALKKLADVVAEEAAAHPGVPVEARRGPILFQRVLHLAQVDRRTRSVGLQDGGSMRLDGMDPVSILLANG